MDKELVIPPPYVWDRIEKILDEQDNARKHAEKLISDTFRKSLSSRRNNLFFAALAGISLLSFIIWNYKGNFKKQLI